MVCRFCQYNSGLISEFLCTLTVTILDPAVSSLSKPWCFPAPAAHVRNHGRTAPAALTPGRDQTASSAPARSHTVASAAAACGASAPPLGLGRVARGGAAAAAAALASSFPRWPAAASLRPLQVKRFLQFQLQFLGNGLQVLSANFWLNF